MNAARRKRRRRRSATKIHAGTSKSPRARLATGEGAALANKYFESQRNLEKQLPVLAKYLDQIVQLQSTQLTPEQRRRIKLYCVNFAATLREQIGLFSNRLHAAFARNFLTLRVRPLIELFADSETSCLFGTAFFRDQLISGFLLYQLAQAKQKDDVVAVARIKQLWEGWDRTDKGPLARSRTGVRALDFLRKADLRRVVTFVRKQDTTRFESALFAPIRQSLFEPESTKFEEELVKAKRFRASRLQPRRVTITEEKDLRTDLTGYGILCELAAIHNVGSVDDLIENFAPGWTAENKSNFRKLLHQCFVPWTRQKRGRPRRSKK